MCNECGSIAVFIEKLEDMDILEQQLREKFKLVLRNLEGGAREVATKNGIPRSD